RTANGKTQSIRRRDVDTIIKDKPKEAVAETPATPAPESTTPPATEAAKAPGAVKPANDKLIKEPEPRSETPKADLAGRPPFKAGTPPPTTPGPDFTKSDTAAAGEPPMSGFPEHAKRMSKRKEALLADALNTIKSAPNAADDNVRASAMADIQALGPEVMPYLWAGVQNEDTATRISSMRLIGAMSGRNCVKRVIETFYMTMPEASAAATWNVPFIEAIKTTLTAITGQAFITTEARRVGVQDGLKKYVEWYKANYEKLPKQIGEPDLDVTDPAYATKLKELRELKLTKREWPAPTGTLPVDQVAGPNKNSPDKGPAPITKFDERPADTKFGQSIPTVSRDDSLKRPGLDPDQAPTRTDSLKRNVDKLNQDAQNQNNNSRDPSLPASDPSIKKVDPLARPQDLRKNQDQ
ncbi:MAG TPA: hypothetical protein VKX17_19175, partial [Planctomycetota bacterium]|nr:hypothetical protein [Planctomycetota bacterium]